MAAPEPGAQTRRALLLPGLDGTGDLFEPLLRVAPPGLSIERIRLPSEGPQTYPVLADWVAARTPADAPLALIAESFSGPLALLLADRLPNVDAIVLVASFIVPPLPRWLTGVQHVSRYGAPPRTIVKLLLTGGDVDLAGQVRRALERTGAHAVSARIAAALASDAAAELARFRGRLLYLRALRDRIVYEGALEQIREIRPDTLAISIDAPHLLLQTQPEEAWVHINRFLAQRKDPA